MGVIRKSHFSNDDVAKAMDGFCNRLLDAGAVIFWFFLPSVSANVNG